MRILLDADVPAALCYRLRGHDTTTAQRVGWGLLKNGDLLKAAEAKGFDVFLTGDKGIRYQQNLQGRKLALVVLWTTHWKTLRGNTSPVLAAINRAKPGGYEELAIPKLPVGSQNKV